MAIRGGLELLLQAGLATALHWAINSVKKGGVVSIVGVYGPTDNLVPVGNVVNKGITIRANQSSVKRLLPRLIKHVQNGVLVPKGLITHQGLERRYSALCLQVQRKPLRPLAAPALADRVSVVEGIVDDLAHGHVPNIFTEKGCRAH